MFRIKIAGYDFGVIDVSDPLAWAQDNLEAIEIITPPTKNDDLLNRLISMVRKEDKIANGFLPAYSIIILYS